MDLDVHEYKQKSVLGAVLRVLEMSSDELSKQYWLRCADQSAKLASSAAAVQ